MNTCTGKENKKIEERVKQKWEVRLGVNMQGTEEKKLKKENKYCEGVRKKTKV